MLVSPTINSVHGRIFLHAAPNPAAGAEAVITVPARRRWRIHSIRFALVTDATAVARDLGLIFSDGSNEIFRLYQDQSQIQSLTRYYQFFILPFAPFTVSTQIYVWLPPLILPAASTITTTTTNIQAGDDYGTPQVLVEEWIDP